MEIIKNLLIRLRHTGVLLVVGLILIVYVALGFVYWQQGAQQDEYTKQIASLTVILAKPLPSSEQLQAESENISRALAPMTNVKAIEMLQDIAEKNGIDVDEESGKFSIPTGIVSGTNVGGGTYQILSFSGIHVQGDYDNVMAFISDLDEGKTTENYTGEMVLKRVTTSEVEVVFAGEEGARRAEFRSVASAVKAMMADNALYRIPNPTGFAGGVASDNMTMFPDSRTTAAEKGYSGNATVGAGYVLYKHDKISTDNTTQFKTVSYIDVSATKYYYTCEADGTVRQFNKADVDTAKEYPTSQPSKIELVVNLNVDIYFKP